jgi:hypothetical protein
LKKKNTKKTGIKKEEKDESPPAAEPEKAGPEPDTATTEAELNPEDEKAAKDEGDTVSELNRGASHQRTPSMSQQSRMRSSSFKQGLPSPGYGFPTDGDTAPEIHRKQAMKIEELERENKRLAKEAIEGERRWKKAEEELEELRDAEGDSAAKGAGGGTSGEIEKLVCFGSFVCLSRF